MAKTLDVLILELEMLRKEIGHGDCPVMVIATNWVEGREPCPRLIRVSKNNPRKEVYTRGVPAVSIRT